MNTMRVTGITTIFQYYCKSSKVTKIQLKTGNVFGKRKKLESLPNYRNICTGKY